MADRFPLILNTNANQIQEIASGDTLDLTNNNISNAGIITASIFSGAVVAGAGVSNITAGIGTYTDLRVGGDTTFSENFVVTGNARVTGILTVGTSSIILNDGTDTIKVGSQNLNPTGFEVNQINASGIITASTFIGALTGNVTGNVVGNVSGNANGLTGTPDISVKDLDVDGHTNLDNVSVAGVTTFTGAIDANGELDVDGPTHLDYVSISGVTTHSDTVHIIDDKVLMFGSGGDSTIEYDENGTDQLTIAGAVTRFTNTTQSTSKDSGSVIFEGGIGVEKNLFVGGNVSVGGTLTYEDVTNIDSVGIVTARLGAFIPDDNTLKFGNTSASPDLTIEHVSSGTYNRLHASSGYMQYRASAHFLNDEASSINFIRCENKGVKLAYNGSTKLSTETGGVNITGVCTATSFVGNGANITAVNAATVGGIAAGSFLRGDASSIFNCNGYNFSFDFDTIGRDSIQFTQGGSLRFQLVHSNNGNDIDIIKHGSAADIKIAGARILTTADEGTGNGLDADTVDGIQGNNIVTLTGTQTINGTKNFNCSGYDVQLSYDNSRTLVSILRSTTEKVRLHTDADTVLVETFNSGVIRWKTGLVPNADDTYDLGATGTRWRNLYVNDLQLSNESKKDKGGNDVDGTWGDWTLQEGDENIFMLNNRTGKKYKMNLTEVE